MYPKVRGVNMTTRNATPNFKELAVNYIRDIQWDYPCTAARAEDEASLADLLEQTWWSARLALLAEQQGIDKKAEGNWRKVFSQGE